MPPPAPPIVGDRFVHLILLSLPFRSPSSSSRHPLASCLCDCGRTVTIRLDNLLSGNTTSCGCRRNVSHRHPPTFNSWRAMRRRCYDVNFPAYPNYGMRGIRVHEAWNDSRTGYLTFAADAGLRPPSTTLDRIDVSGHYEPGNVRWATPLVQYYNRRTIITVTDEAREAAYWDEQEAAYLTSLTESTSIESSTT